MFKITFPAEYWFPDSEDIKRSWIRATGGNLELLGKSMLSEVLTILLKYFLEL